MTNQHFDHTSKNNNSINSQSICQDNNQEDKSKKIILPITKEIAQSLTVGDYVYLTGIIYSARDAAHKRMTETLASGGVLPLPIKDQTIYYLGPTPARPGQVIGSAGPTTSSRMDKYTPTLLALGMTGMIGKGRRSKAVAEAMREHHAVYFAAVGGAGALLSKCIKKAEVVAYEDLGAEAIYKLEVEDFPVIVVMDDKGGNLYTE
ncbi:MAG: Fe-S-containing hydro-lyase [Lachnospiraceae bacterium]|nr:Fe-S-containing hydro-lyase [Lachnospiraceae bacterium]